MPQLAAYRGRFASVLDVPTEQSWLAVLRKMLMGVDVMGPPTFMGAACRMDIPTEQSLRAAFQKM